MIILLTKYTGEVTEEGNSERLVLHVTRKERSLYSDLFAERTEDVVH